MEVKSKKMRFVVFCLAILFISFTNANARVNYGKIMVVGDSYSLGFNTNNNFQDILENSWPNKMATNLGINVNTDLTGPRKGGTGFCAIHEGETFVSMLEKYVQNETNMKNASQIKWIVVVGGYNDAAQCNKNDTEASIARFIKIARAHFVNANIVIGSAGWNVSDTNIQNKMTTAITPAYKNAASNFGAYYVTGIEEVLKSDATFFSSDGLHPNTKGEEALAKKISDYISSVAKESTNDQITGEYYQVSPSTDNGAYFSNKDFPYNTGNDDADPHMVKDKDTYYVYVTNNKYYKTKDFKNWIIPEDNSAIKRNIPSQVQYHWAPEVFKVGNYWYMISSFINWGDGYPHCSTSSSFIGVSRTTNLDNGFEYLGKIDSKLNTLGFDLTDCGDGNKWYNTNFIDGSVLIDKDANGTDHYYLYYKAEHNQHIYAIEMKFYGNEARFETISEKPIEILHKNGTNEDLWGNGVSEGPNVWKHHGYYSMLYSSGNYKGDEGGQNIYATGYAWSNNPLTGWSAESNQSTYNKFPFFYGAKTFAKNGTYGGIYYNNEGNNLPVYAPGHGSIYEHITDNVGNSSEWYYVHHSVAYGSDNKYFNRRVNIQRMGTSDGAVYINGASNNIQPLMSNTTYNNKIYTQLKAQDLTITLPNNQDQSIVLDGAIYNASSGLPTWSTKIARNIKEVTINFQNRLDISDIWLASGGESLEGVAAIVYINESSGRPYYYKINDLGSLLGGAMYKKIQLPDISSSESTTKVEGGYKKIRIVFAKEINLTEITPIRRGTETYNPVSYTITYNGNKGSSPSQVSKSYGSTIGTLPTSNREGYTFIGWYTDETGGEKITSNTVVKKSQTYYAHWSINTHKLTVNPNGGTYENSSSNSIYNMNYNTSKTLKNPTRAGYTFKEWRVTGTGYTSPLINNTFTMKDADATLTAEWNINTYKITIDANGGTYKGSSTQTVIDSNYGSTIKLDIPERTGHTFIGWKSTNNTSITNNNYTVGLKDDTITAEWVKNDYKYLVYHEQMNLDGESYSRVVNDTMSGMAKYLEKITPETKTYKGFTSPSKKTIEIQDDEKKNIINYLYSRNKYNITIKYSDSDTTTSKEFYNSTIELKCQEKEGYNCNGFTASKGKITDSKYTVIDSDAVITVNYKPITYKINLELNGGSSETSYEEYTIESDKIVVKEPVKEGYIFVGWQEVGSDKMIKNLVIEKNSTGNISYYAVWQKIGPTDEEIIIDGEEITNPQTGNNYPLFLIPIIILTVLFIKKKTINKKIYKI